MRGCSTGSKGPSDSTINQELAIANQQSAVATSSNARADTLFNEIGLPGLTTAKSYYDKLASGDPNALFTATAPATTAIDTNTAATIKNIQDTSPRGGTKLLGEEEAKISAAGQKGNLITQAYTGAPAAEAQLGSGGTGLSINEVANAISGFSGASSTTAGVANQQAAGKASQLAFFGALAGAGGQAAAGMCWVAELLYGEFDERTTLLRRWLSTVYAFTPVGSVAVWLYRRYGKRVARLLKAVPLLQSVVRPLFDHWLRMAERV